MVSVENLRFSYGRDEVLRRISFEVERGKFVSVIGPNGSGKTTLLKNLSKLLNPAEGHIEIKNESIKRYKSRQLAKTMAVVHQGTSNAFDFNVGEVVLMGRYPHLEKLKSETREDMTIAEQAMQLTGIYHLREKTLQSISGGERQRVMIARALTQEPELLLLDEPISHLDIKYQLEILKLCKALNTSKGITVLTTLHDINLASRFSDMIIMMKSGKIHKMGRPEEVVTSENIRAVYDVDVVVVNKPYPMIIPV